MRRCSQDCALTSIVLVAACSPVAPGDGAVREPAGGFESAVPEASASASAPASATVQASASATVPASASASASGAAAPDPVADWPAVLARHAVSPGNVARRSLWTWTTIDQGRGLASGTEPVLTRETSARLGPSAFDWMLSDAARSDRLAALLFHQGYAKKRFAWSTTYGAALGTGGERYGSVLMRVDLAENALVLDWTRRAVTTAGGKPAKLDELFKEPGRLAAVYWETAQFREYVLVNESQIERVLVADAEVMRAFMQERALVSAVVRAARSARDTERDRILRDFAATLIVKGTSNLTAAETFEDQLVQTNIDGLDGQVAPKAKFNLGPQRATLKDDCKFFTTRDPSFSRTVCQPTDRCTTTTDQKCVPLRRSGIGED
jgi:hypothetical protein